MPENKSWLKEHGVAAAVVAGVFGLVGVVITGIFGIAGSGDTTGPGAQTTTSPAPTIPPTAPSSTTSSPPLDCGRQLRIIAPVKGTKISASQGVTLEGTACESDLLWVLDYDPSDGSYFQVNNEPLQPVGGQWIQVDKPIGDPADEVGTVYTIVVIRATQACSDRLKAARPDEDGTVWFKPLPPGCPTFGDEANVRAVQVVNAGP